MVLLLSAADKTCVYLQAHLPVYQQVREEEEHSACDISICNPPETTRELATYHCFQTSCSLSRCRWTAFRMNHFSRLFWYFYLKKIAVVFCHNNNCVITSSGGYDQRLAENREHLQELKTLAEEEGVAEQVIFVPSCSTSQRNALLAACICVLYTPTVSNSLLGNCYLFVQSKLISMTLNANDNHVSVTE